MIGRGYQMSIKKIDEARAFARFEKTEMIRHQQDALNGVLNEVGNLMRY